MSHVHKKMNRMKTKLRKKKIETKKGKGITAIMFDERKDTTKVISRTTDENKNIFEYKKTDNCTVAVFTCESKVKDKGENPCKYLGHCSPTGGSGKELAESVHEHLISY